MNRLKYLLYFSCTCLLVMQLEQNLLGQSAQNLRCESGSGEIEVCPVQGEIGKVQLLNSQGDCHGNLSREISPGSQGTMGIYRNSVWVANGCKGFFEVVLENPRPMLGSLICTENGISIYANFHAGMPYRVVVSSFSPLIGARVGLIDGSNPSAMTSSLFIGQQSGLQTQFYQGKYYTPYSIPAGAHSDLSRDADLKVVVAEGNFSYIPEGIEILAGCFL